MESEINSVHSSASVSLLSVEHAVFSWFAVIKFLTPFLTHILISFSIGLQQFMLPRIQFVCILHIISPFLIELLRTYLSSKFPRVWVSCSVKHTLVSIILIGIFRGLLRFVQEHRSWITRTEDNLHVSFLSPIRSYYVQLKRTIM
jgi:uncharacterized membrane protein (DUF373 family)